MSLTVRTAVLCCLILLVFSLSSASIDDGKRRGPVGVFKGPLNEQTPSEPAPVVKQNTPLDQAQENSTTAVGSTTAEEEDEEEFDIVTLDDDLDFSSPLPKTSSPQQTPSPSPTPPSLSPPPSPPSPSPPLTSPSPSPSKTVYRRGSDVMPTPFVERVRNEKPDPSTVAVRTRSVPSSHETEAEEVAKNSASPIATTPGESSGGSAAVVVLLTIVSLAFATVAAVYSYRLYHQFQIRRYRGWRPYEYELTHF